MRRPAKSKSMMMEGRIRGLGRGGDGVMESAAGIVFVPGALANERVKVQVTGKVRGVIRGRLVEVLEPASSRVQPPCPEQGRCGGCPLMVLSLVEQRAHKRAMVESAVRKYSAAGVVVDIVAGSSVSRYRGRARLAFIAERGSRRLGYRKEASRNLADIDSCDVLHPVIMSGLSLARKRVLPGLSGVGELAIGLGSGGLPVLWWQCRDLQAPALYQELTQMVDEGLIAGATLTTDDGTATARFGDARQSTEGCDGQPLVGPAGGFSQTNLEVNRELYAFVMDAAQAKGRSVLELFCGHGNLTVGLSAVSPSLDAVESDKNAVESCRENLKARGVTGARIHVADVAEFSPKRKADVVVLDPPRTGAKEVLPVVVAMRPKAIVYVSCDPPTLARDLGTLHEAGYVVDRASAFDMFPHTAHVEAAVRLVRKPIEA